jgi:tRNA1(Val) A37 N6-methylase TrmN6
MELRQIQSWIDRNASFTDDLQDVATPISLFDKCISKIDSDLSTKKILVLYNIEAVLLLVKNYKTAPKNIYFFTQSNKKSSLLKQIGINIFYTNIKNEPIEYLNSINMKFDSIIINPPYSQGLHYDFFVKSFDLLKENGKLTCIHPSTGFINRKQTKRKGNEKKAIEIVNEYQSTIELVDGNSLFKQSNVGMLTPLSITNVTKNKDNQIDVIYSHIKDKNKVTVKNVDDIFIHGNQIVKSIMDKIFSKMEKSIHDKLSRNGSFNRVYLKINSIAGHPPTSEHFVNPDFYCFIYKNDENKINDLVSTSYKLGDKNYISFENKNQAKNCFQYLLTKFSRFCLSLYKINVQLSRGELKSVPYLDFNQDWSSDKKCYDYFNLTKEEISFIENYIENYYDRDCNKNK